MAGYFIVNFAQVAVHLHQRIAVGPGSLRDEVIDVVRPVLNRRTGNAASLHQDLTIAECRLSLLESEP